MNLPEFFRFFIRESTRFVSPIAVAIEWVLVAIAALLIVIAPSRRSSGLLRVRKLFVALARRKHLAICFSALLPVVLRLSLLGVIPPPDPSIHDEFSHLLLGDTLAHGRLTNPTHPMWQHFESIHIIQQPTYASMYPPVQGIFLGLGEKLGDPWIGVIISVSLMCAAVCWMMQGWMPPEWALFGTILLILKLCVNGLWINSYLGGSGSAIGGALLIGSLPRLQKYRHAVSTAAMLAGLGVVILINTRPFDGGILSLVVLVCLIPTLRKRLAQSRAATIRLMLLPAGIVLLCGGLLTGYYSWRVTGSPLRVGYQINRDTYGWPENLGFLPAKKLHLRHKALQDMYVKEVEHRKIYSNATSLLDNFTTRAFDNWTYFLGPLLTIPLLFLPWILRQRRSRLLVLFVALVLFLNLFQMVLYPYHLGAVVPCLFAIVALGCRHLYVMLRRNRGSKSLYFVTALPLFLILVAAMKQEARALELPLAYWEITAEPHRDARAALEDWLMARPRKQLVIVRYGPSHTPNQEWVYNDADIDGSKVVWAREMDPASNKKLIEYFHDRDAWLLEADVWPTRVVPYRVQK